MLTEVIEYSEQHAESIDLINQKLIQSGNQMVYYSSAFLKFLKGIMPDSRFYYILARNESGLQGVLPFCGSTKDGFTVINSLPFYGSYGGPLVFDQSLTMLVGEALLTRLHEFGAEFGAKIVNFVENPLAPISTLDMDKIGFEKIDERIGQFTPFPSQTEADLKEVLMNVFHSKTRNMVRKGEKLNLVIELRTDSASYDWLHSEHEKSILKLGGLPKSRDIFNVLQNTFGDNCRLYIGCLNGEPICGVLVILYNQTVEYFTPVIKEEHRETQGLSFLIYDAMLKLINEGYRQWNWGGTWLSQEGVYRFKSRWGAKDFHYNYYALRNMDSSEFPSLESLQSNFPYYYLYKY